MLTSPMIYLPTAVVNKILGIIGKLVCYIVLIKKNYPDLCLVVMTLLSRTGLLKLGMKVIL